MNLYLKGLIITLAGLLPVLFLILQLLKPSSYIDITLTGTGLFIVLSAALYFVLHYFARHPNKQLFTSITMINILIKIIMTGLLIFGYIREAAPADNNFVMIILAIYIAFTIFETWFMTQLAQSQFRK